MKSIVRTLALLLASYCSLLGAQERTAPSVATAQQIAVRALGDKCSANVDCRFDAKRIDSGWIFVVWFCYKQPDGSCAWRVGSNGHAFVDVMDDGTVKVRNGA